MPTIRPGKFACVYCNQTFDFSSDLDDHACPTQPAPSAPVEDIQYSPVSPSAPSAQSAVKNSVAAKSAESAKGFKPSPCICGKLPVYQVADYLGIGLHRLICQNPACTAKLNTTGESQEEVLLRWNKKVRAASSSLPSLPSVEKSSEQKAAKEAKENPLAPCPWCKKTPTLEEDDDGVDIFCETTGCLVSPRLELPHTNGDTVAEITAVWNRCAPPAPATETLSRVDFSHITKLLGAGGQDALIEWVAMRRLKRYPVTDKLVAKWSAFLAKHGEAAFVAALVHSTTEEYRALVPAPCEAQAPKAAKKGADHARGF